MIDCLRQACVPPRQGPGQISDTEQQRWEIIHRMTKHEGNVVEKCNKMHNKTFWGCCRPARRPKGPISGKKLLFGTPNLASFWKKFKNMWNWGWCLQGLKCSVKSRPNKNEKVRFRGGPIGLEHGKYNVKSRFSSSQTNRVFSGFGINSGGLLGGVWPTFRHFLQFGHVFSILFCSLISRSISGAVLGCEGLRGRRQMCARWGGIPFGDPFFGFREGSSIRLAARLMAWRGGLRKACF